MSMPQNYRTYVRRAVGTFLPVDEVATVNNLANLVDRHRVKRLVYRLKNFSAVICVSRAQILTHALRVLDALPDGQPHSEGDPEWRSIVACPNGRRARARLSAGSPPGARLRHSRLPAWRRLRIIRLRAPKLISTRPPTAWGETICITPPQD